MDRGPNARAVPLVARARRLSTLRLSPCSTAAAAARQVISASSSALGLKSEPIARARDAAPVERRPARRLKPRAWQAPLWGAAGLALIAFAFSLAREGRSGTLANVLFLVGFATLIWPIAAHLLSESTPRAERIALATLAGLLAYAVKVLHDPLMFAMPDEFFHLVATQQIATAHKLFETLPIGGLNVTGKYPGLEIVTASVSEITGLSLFCSGLIVIGVARIIIMLALFHLYERVSGSPRIAGLGVLLFAANGNFLYFSAQFSYESLALPLFVLALALYAMRSERRIGRLPLTLTLMLIVATITATHHVTSYALAASLWILTLFSLLKAWRGGRALGLALLATAAPVAWALLVAKETGSYLGGVFSGDLRALGNLAQATHAPFQSSTEQLQTPIGEQLISFAGVLLIIAGLLWTLRSWMPRGARRMRALQSPAGIFFAACALGFLAFYPQRLFPRAWETANRGQEFLFIGAALLLGLALVRLARRLADRRWRTLLVAAIVVVICGGVISGSTGPLLLAQPLQVRVGKAVIVPQGLSVASWATRELPKNSVYYADEASGRELAVDGAHRTYFGTSNVPTLLEHALFPQWERREMIKRGVDFVVVDRRKISSNNQAGYFFQPADDPTDGLGYYPEGVRAKFAIPKVSSIFDSGDIVVYDVRGMQEERQCSTRCLRITP